MAKKIYKVEGMHCSSCALSIEMDLEDMGVKANCNFIKETLAVEFDEKSLSEEDIKKTLTQAGYSITTGLP